MYLTNIVDINGYTHFSNYLHAIKYIFNITSERFTLIEASRSFQIEFTFEKIIDTSITNKITIKRSYMEDIKNERR
jgi:hypothetical protein